MMRRPHDVLSQMPSKTYLMPPPTASSRRGPSLARLLQLILGGAICGTFTGSFTGAILGVLIGVFVDDLSLGLDGAILGSAVLALAGAIYGAVLGVREKRPSTVGDREEAPSETTARRDS
jgi:hypothetical protein